MMYNTETMPRRAPVSVLGIPFDPVTTGETIQRIEAMIASGRPHYLVTANVDFLVQAQTDIELRRILLDADLVLCDGTPVVWASKLFGNPLPERVAGSDLVPDLIRLAAQKGYRLFFLGAAPETASKAISRVRAQHPDLIIAGHYSPPYHQLLEMDHLEIRKRILEARADILLVCFGCPKQEKWIAMHYRELGVPVAAGVGGTIDFLAGQLKRAPGWMQRIGAEWAYRLIQEPRRLFRRYARDLGAFSFGIGVQWCTLRGFGSFPRQMVEVVGPEDHGVVMKLSLPPRLDLDTTLQLLEVAPAAGDRSWLLFADRVTFVDSSGLAWLAMLQKKARWCGRCVILVSPSAALIRILRRMRLAEFFHTAPDVVSAMKWVESQMCVEAVVVTCDDPGKQPELRFRGEITAANAQPIWAQAQLHLSGLRTGQAWKFNLREVPFIDSTGLTLVLRAASAVRQAGATLDLIGIQPAVLNVVRHGHAEEALLGKRRPATFRLARVLSPARAG